MDGPKTGGGAGGGAGGASGGARRHRGPRHRGPRPQSQQQQTRDGGDPMQVELPVAPLSTAPTTTGGPMSPSKQRSHQRSESGTPRPDKRVAHSDPRGAGPTTSKPAPSTEDRPSTSTPRSVEGGSGESRAFMSETRFDSLSISSLTRRALAEVLQYPLMTRVQDATLPVIAKGGDVIARAKTGTGKTLAFLIPSIEGLALKAPSPSAISVLVISPTRELATQIATEAKALLTFHPFKVQCVVGGTNINTEQRALNGGRCDILVATPGRLQDHFESTKGLLERLGSLRVLVLDEADQLLNMGFRPAIEKLLFALPTRRQTLLFSATVDKELHAIAGMAMNKERTFVDTVGDEEDNTNAHVIQKYAVTSIDDQLPVLLSVLREHIAAEPTEHKIIVFCTTARLTQYMAELFAVVGGMEVLEIHSRLSQSKRTKVSEQFRKGTGMVLFSSDVSARGMDYPDVTFVCQVGVPSDKAQYIHRLGRTGRAGKPGHGLLLLADFEQYFLRDLRDISIEQRTDIRVSPSAAAEIQRAQAKVKKETAEMAYQAWLGYYNSQRRVGWDKPTLVQRANYYAGLLGLSYIPALQKKTIGKMGLKGVPGLVIESEPSGGRGGAPGGGRGGAPGGGRGGSQAGGSGGFGGRPQTAGSSGRGGR